MTEGDSYRQGDVVLVPMDFTDGTGSKGRPAIVVSVDRYHQLSPDVLVASITSHLDAVAHPGDHPIHHWKEAGLLKPSLAQTKLATVDQPVIRRKLGTLHTDDLKQFQDGLRIALGLECH